MTARPGVPPAFAPLHPLWWALYAAACLDTVAFCFRLGMWWG